MQFVLNNEWVTSESLPPDTTLLRFLRDHRQLTGTKEGCASGDCGACTVLVGRPGFDGIHYSAVNSCILPLASVQNQYVMTVEGLSKQGLVEGSLHPVQEAMVACHGSQCGFCTPGFVMSLAALHQYRNQPRALDSQGILQDDPSLQRDQVLDAISGNLCRCTGYRPILDAALQALQQPTKPINSVQFYPEDAPIAGTASLNEGTAHYWQPITETELQVLLQDHPGARLIAGGTDLMLEVTQAYKTLPELIDVSRIPSLATIELSDHHVSLGAAATYTQIEAALSHLSPAFISLLGRLGSRQIRNRGTLGGNICNASPIADCPPVMLVLNAHLVIGNAQGSYRQLPLSDFYLDYKRTRLAVGEYLARVVIDRSALNTPLKLYKLSKRYEDDISAVMGAFRIQDDQFFIAYGGLAAIPKRALATETFISQHLHQLTPERLEQACQLLAQEFKPLSDVRASAKYRSAMAANLLRKACAALIWHEQPEPEVFAHA